MRQDNTSTRTRRSPKPPPPRPIAPSTSTTPTPPRSRRKSKPKTATVRKLSAIRFGPCPREARNHRPHEYAGEPAGDRASDARRVQSALRAVPRLRDRRQASFRGRQLAGDQPRLARPHRLLRSPRRRNRRASAARIRLHRQRRRALGGGQAPLRRAADRPQAAGVRRDVLQHGVVQDPRSQLLPQPLPVRPPGDLDRAHRRRPAFVSLVLSAPARAAARADRHRARLPSRTALCRFSRRPRATCWPRSGSAFRGRSGSRPTIRSRCCRASSSAIAPPTSSGA